jgi:DNA-binding transcriptional LysR family regulator
MDSRYLKSLIATIDLGSIADAARAEGLTAAAVSQRIKALEREFGFELLSRIGHSAKATEYCVSILPRARRIVHEVELLAGDVDPEGLLGTLRIGAISTALTGMLPAALRALAHHAARIKPAIVPGSSRSLYQALLDDKLDAAILAAPPFAVPKGLRSTHLRSEPLVFLSRTKPRERIAHLLTQRPYLRYDPETWGGRFAEHYLNDHAIATTPMCDLDALEAIAMLVADDMGVSLVPHWPGLDSVARVCHLTPIPGPQYQRQIVMLSKVQTDRPRMISLLAQSLLDSAQ